MPKSLSDKLTASGHKVSVGKNLTLARESLGRRQAEFGREFGIEPNKLNQWEAGMYYPDPYFLTRLCEEYGFTMDWFYRGVRAGVSAERAAGLRQAAVAKKSAQPGVARQAPSI